MYSLQVRLLRQVGYVHAQVHELPQSAQDVISRQLSTAGNPAAAFSEAAVQRPWAQTATEADYDELAAVSEYASWVLAHGYALNHMTVAVHRLPAADDPAKPAFRCITCQRRPAPAQNLAQTEAQLDWPEPASSSAAHASSMPMKGRRTLAFGDSVH